MAGVMCRAIVPIRPGIEGMDGRLKQSSVRRYELPLKALQDERWYLPTQVPKSHLTKTNPAALPQRSWVHATTECIAPVDVHGTL
ncbi:hypothetical protein K443DRAFT_4224 [Laccaria amethystina LaAM-08-1]|uniref:Unplaced genomic scaffold K443scaffold_30, whole genome shotgun sequence n=1 Tax=Laccaria amethystina LaAM-08-1 TaxID=1095629 RepID=A0A0C9XT02_9AGAR|nr:hypothetical protein K443DRAFT_4224 [Laccaria amethystina LaAM-08-1]